MDDHIIHDSKAHFPDLLAALIIHENDPKISGQIKNGIDIVNQYRKTFYMSVSRAFDFGEPIRDYYTVGA